VDLHTFNAVLSVSFYRSGLRLVCDDNLDPRQHRAVFIKQANVGSNVGERGFFRTTRDVRDQIEFMLLVAVAASPSEWQRLLFLHRSLNPLSHEHLSELVQHRLGALRIVLVREVMHFELTFTSDQFLAATDATTKTF
jgi:hypothetical protein